MLLCEIFDYYPSEDFFNFEITEGKNEWQVLMSKNFKKGLKKHRNNSAVVDSLDELLEFIQKHDKKPAIREYPVYYNVHQLAKNKIWNGVLWAHLKGQKIGLIFDVTNDKEIRLIHLGTHQEAGFGKGGIGIGKFKG